MTGPNRSSTHGTALALVAYVGCYLLTLGLTALGLPTPAILGLMVVLWPTAIVWRIIALGPIGSAEVIFIVLLAAGQNVALGLLAPFIDANALKYLLSTNFLFGTMALSILAIARRDEIVHPETRFILAVLVSLAATIALSIVVVGSYGAATIASVRNLTSPVMFFGIGFLSTRNRPWSRDFQRAMVVLGVVVVLFGLIERFVIPDLWLSLNITELWEKKELSNIGVDGLPRNWYSAEQIGGDAIRRMVSTFAEPVNLGTFLFLFFVAAIAERRSSAAILSVIGILLSVSKGGALGLLIFAATAAYVFASRTVFVAVCIATASAGAAFIIYSLQYATGSLLVHLTGFSNAFATLFTHPLGEGVGRVGRLAEQFVFLAEQDIAESGVGVIIGQLGLPGLVIYTALFVGAAHRLSRLSDRLSRTVGLSLLFGAAANIAFNEVGLSPNSTAGHFFWVGALVAVATAQQGSARIGEGRGSSARVHTHSPDQPSSAG